MISRVLIRLAIVWAVGIGGLLVANRVIAGAPAQEPNWPAIIALLFGPLVIAWALAWVFRRPGR